VPDPADEDQRHLHRELDQLRRERIEHGNRVRSLLAAIGIKVPSTRNLPCDLGSLRQWNGEPVPEGLKRRLTREFERMELLARQIRAVETEQAEQIFSAQNKRFGGGTSRMKRAGFVAAARKLLIALWRYAEQGEIPEGAMEADWEAKLKLTNHYVCNRVERRFTTKAEAWGVRNTYSRNLHHALSEKMTAGLDSRRSIGGHALPETERQSVQP